jgi:hypothetical protein
MVIEPNVVPSIFMVPSSPEFGALLSRRSIHLQSAHCVHYAGEELHSAS